MNKIISINIKGFVFQVEEEAYDRMKNYLETLNRYFANEESRIEILDDIESRLAEMMQEKLKTRPVITVADVEDIINIMGRPTDFDKEKEPADGGESAKSSGPTYENTTYEKVHKRFMRDTENSLLGGVCSGAGHYFGVDPLWIRLGFLFLFFVMGTGLLFYLILWVIIPEAKTPTDRLQMRGEKINIDNIERAVKEEYERVKKNFNDIGRKSGKPLNKAVGIAGDIIKSAVKFIAKVIAVFLVFIAITVLVVLISVAVQLFVDGTLPLVSLAFDAKWQFWLTAIAALYCWPLLSWG
ncbi:MAG TPA: PspC domain-containing protein [Bacteroidia bacterium]|nr:PspC domain-containing protein [Bacteroidia bacterium]